MDDDFGVFGPGFDGFDGFMDDDDFPLSSGMYVLDGLEGEDSPPYAPPSPLGIPLPLPPLNDLSSFDSSGGIYFDEDNILSEFPLGYECDVDSPSSDTPPPPPSPGYTSFESPPPPPVPADFQRMFPIPVEAHIEDLNSRFSLIHFGVVATYLATGQVMFTNVPQSPMPASEFCKFLSFECGVGCPPSFLFNSCFSDIPCIPRKKTRVFRMKKTSERGLTVNPLQRPGPDFHRSGPLRTERNGNFFSNTCFVLYFNSSNRRKMLGDKEGAFAKLITSIDKLIYMISPVNFIFFQDSSLGLTKELFLERLSYLRSDLARSIGPTLSVSFRVSYASRLAGYDCRWGFFHSVFHSEARKFVNVLERLREQRVVNWVEERSLDVLIRDNIGDLKNVLTNVIRGCVVGFSNGVGNGNGIDGPAASFQIDDIVWLVAVGLNMVSTKGLPKALKSLVS